MQLITLFIGSIIIVFCVAFYGAQHTVGRPTATPVAYAPTPVPLAGTGDILYNDDGDMTTEATIVGPRTLHYWVQCDPGDTTDISYNIDGDITVLEPNNHFNGLIAVLGSGDHDVVFDATCNFGVR